MVVCCVFLVLGCVLLVILVGDDCVLIWLCVIVGSIVYDEMVCIVVMVECDCFKVLGVDIELFILVEVELF